VDANARRQVVEAMLARGFRGLALTDVRVLGEEDGEGPLVLRWSGRVARLARPAAGGGLVLDTAILPARLGARFVQVADRSTPLLLGAEEREVLRIEVRAPEGLVPVAGPARAAEGPAGAFARTERIEGQTLVREDRLELSRARIAPDRYRALAGFAAAVDDAQQAPSTFVARPAG
jgi:cellulose synthase operon protein C